MIENNKHFKLINESFPHIGEQLESLWGHTELYGFIDDLLKDTRDGKRKGFSLDILIALENLDSEHDQEFPQLARKIQRGDAWGL
jgi:hypothetical protein